MIDRTQYRLSDILDAIHQIDELLQTKTFADLLSDRPLKAAFERFLEILSEAARHIPEDLRNTEPNIEWRKISDIGNHLRHAYHRVDAEILWNLYKQDKLEELKLAVGRILVLQKASEN
jgi:uncharacterized protein with HEPN domain